MKDVRVEVLEPEPPCMRCQADKKVEEKVARLKQAELRVRVEKINMTAKGTVSNYSIMMSPATAINGLVMCKCRMPSEGESDCQDQPPEA